MAALLATEIKKISPDIWLQVIPQLIARLVVCALRDCNETKMDIKERSIGGGFKGASQFYTYIGVEPIFHASLLYIDSGPAHSLSHQ